MKRWELRKQECGEDFRKEVRAVLGCVVEFPDDWETIGRPRYVLWAGEGRQRHLVVVG